MYYYNNKNYLIKKLNKKKNIINDLIDYLNNIVIGEIYIKLVTLYNTEDIADLVYLKIKNNEFKINGIIFWPSICGKQYIYINDNEFEKIKLGTDIYAISYGQNIQIENQNIFEKQNFIIQKTGKIDVYEVFDINKIKRYGIACVPDIKTSHYLYDKFLNCDQLIFQCEFNDKFKKWCPIV